MRAIMRRSGRESRGPFAGDRAPTRADSDPLGIGSHLSIGGMLRVAFAAGLLCLGTPLLAGAQQTEEALLRLHRQFVMSQMMDRDPTFLLANSLPSYTVVAPGGVVESREQVIRGFAAFSALDSVTVSREQVILSGEVALVLARQEVHGEIRGPAAGFGPVTTSTVFVRNADGGWSAVSRSVTPCHARAIEAGRC